MRVEFKFYGPILDNSEPYIYNHEVVAANIVRQEGSIIFRDSSGNAYISHNFSVCSRNHDPSKAFLNCLEKVMEGDVNWEMPEIYDVDVRLLPEVEFTLNLDSIPDNLKEIYRQTFDEMFNAPRYTQWIKCIPMADECP